MRVILLGTAAGGGFPQWNCFCPGCETARRDPERARPRLQSSVAVSADGERWFLLDASPDVRQQLTMLPASRVTRALRHSPIEGVLLTDAELDHTLGIPLLRESRALSLYASRAALETLETDSRLLPTTRAFATVSITTLEPGQSVPLLHRDGSASALEVEAVLVTGTGPRFSSRKREGDTAALFVTHRTGVAEGGGPASLAFLPGCGALTPPLLERLASCRAVLVDGTFWLDDELPALGLSDRTALEMGHLPISGIGGSLVPLAELASRGTRVIYVHLNNTNPVLLEDSPERAEVGARCLEVGEDRMAFEL